ncbi:MAG: DUF1573 domain-containing protein [Sphingomonadales bacterium]
MEDYKFIFITLLIYCSFVSCKLRPSSPVIETLFDQVDLGVVDFDSTITIKYLIKNSGNGVLKIDTATSSCGCSNPILSQRILNPGKEGVLSIRFKPVDTGDFKKKIILKSNIDSGFIVFSFSGYAKQYQFSVK